MKRGLVGEAEIHQMNDIKGMVWNAGKEASFVIIGEFSTLPARKKG